MKEQAGTRNGNADKVSKPREQPDAAGLVLPPPGQEKYATQKGDSYGNLFPSNTCQTLTHLPR